MKPRKQKLKIFTPLPVPEAGAGEPPAPPRVAGADPERRHALVAEAAYYRAERRGFAPGSELEDWCAAEHDIDSSLVRDLPATACGT